MSDTPHIRCCTPADFDGVLPLLRQLWPDKVFDISTLRRVYERALNSPDKVYLCTEIDSRLIGFGSLTIKSNLWNDSFVGFVDELVVDAACRGQNIGTRLLDQLLQHARERGCQRVELDSAFHRTWAHAFYERRGFQRRAYLFTKLL